MGQDSPQPLTRSLRFRLSVMWVLEWGITGSILTYLPIYFTTEVGLKQDQLGLLMAVAAVGLWVAPFVVGQICDRWMSSERYLMIAQAVGGTALLFIPSVAESYNQTGENFGWLVLLLGGYAVAYLPTVALASSLTFRHLPNPDKEFGSIRMWGTVGWVASGLVLSVWLRQADTLSWLDNNWSSGATAFREITDRMPEPSGGDSFRIGAALSFLLVAFCFTLPPTPPAKKPEGSSIAPLEAAKLFKNRTFFLMLLISFLMAAIVPTYSFAVPQYLEHLGFDGDWVPAVMTIGQISEFPALLLLSACLSRFGLKTTFALGMAAWLVRYIVFAFDSPTWLILVGVGLHGVCHVFLVIVIQLFVDERCPEGAKASAQNIFAFLTMGIALPIGFVASGMLGKYCLSGDQPDYGFFFLVPAAMIFVLLVVYLAGFRLEPKPTDTVSTLE